MAAISMVTPAMTEVPRSRREGHIGRVENAARPIAPGRYTAARG